MNIELKDPVLDATDPQTRLLLLAEYWKRKYQELIAQRDAVAASGAGVPDDLWIHEDMARDETAAVVGLPRKQLQAAYIQARDDLASWKRRALTTQHDALLVIRDLDKISMELGARLAQMEFSYSKGNDYLLREAVMREVVAWREQWDKNSAARHDFAAQVRALAAAATPDRATKGEAAPRNAGVDGRLAQLSRSPAGSHQSARPKA
jgi:hypothetical protein